MKINTGNMWSISFDVRGYFEILAFDLSRDDYITRFILDTFSLVSRVFIAV